VPTEASRVYDAAVKCVADIRPFLSQAQFGDLCTKHKLDASGKWRIGSQPVRLELGSAENECTVLSINAKMSEYPPSDAGGAVAFVQAYNVMLATVTQVVNDRGGVVLRVESNGTIVCVWGATHAVGAADKRSAVGAARALHRVFSSANISVVSGECMVSNSKLGGHKIVILVGTCVDVLEQCVILNSLSNSRVLVDFPTYAGLPEALREACKPIMTLRSDGNMCILYTADGGGWSDVAQLKLYQAAFSAYQHGMFATAKEEFARYVAAYGEGDDNVQFLSAILEAKLDPAMQLFTQHNANANSTSFGVRRESCFASISA
jgi:hypothetical protein